MLLAPIFLASALLQVGDVRAEAQFSPASAAAGETVELHIPLQISPGWHVYHPDQNPDDGIPVSVAVPEGFEAAGPLISLGPPKRHVERYSADLEVEYLWLEGFPELVLPLRVLEGNAVMEEVSVSVTWQICDESVCLPQETVALAAVFERLPGGSAPANAGSTTVEPAAPGLSLWAFLLLAIGGGLFALVMPCTYPMIPITISFFTKQADARSGNVLPLALAYGAGIVLVFVLVGVLVGPVIIAFAAHPVTNLAIGGLFTVFAFALFGWITLNPPAFLMRAAGQAAVRGGYFGVFLMGTTLVITSFTCTAPFVGTLLAAGAGVGGVARVALGMAVFGLTMALPFVLLSLLPGRMQKMPGSGQWMETVKKVLGFVELAAALKFFSNADIVLSWGILPKEAFLLAWIIILFGAVLYLLGVLRKWGTPRPSLGVGRLLSAGFFAVFGLYCFQGYRGAPLDTIMTAIVPNYSWSAESSVSAHEIIKDDYESAQESALRQEKLLFVNFTGHT